MLTKILRTNRKNKFTASYYTISKKLLYAENCKGIASAVAL